MRLGALTQAARSAGTPRGAALMRQRPRSARAARPPRRVSGPIRGKTVAPKRVAGAARASARPRATRASATAVGVGRGPRVLAAARAASIALPLTLPAPWKRTRRPPVRRERPTVDRDRAAKQPAGFGRRLGSLVIALPDHSWLDRVVRGRAWIPLLGVLLVGIVAAQVEILKLGAAMGRALEQTTNLTTQNEQLRGNVARLADDQRIERLADNMGLVFPPPGAVGYIDARPRGDARGAAANIHAPDPAAFVALVPRNGALVTGSGSSTLPPPAGAPLPPTTATTPNTTATATGAAGSGSATTSTGAATSTSVATPTSTTVSSSTASVSTTPAPTSTISSQTPTQSPTITSSYSGATSPAPPTSPPTQSSTVPATGAAAIQPSGTSQQGGGG